MIMIVYHHFSIHTNWEFPEQLGLRKYLVLSVGNFGKVGVVLFILITGYFFYKQDFSIKKIFYLSNTIRFYSLLFFFLTLSILTFNYKNLMTSILPVIFSQYWFVTGYVILLVFQPFLKKYLSKTTRRKKLTNFLTLLAFFYLPGIFGFLFQIDSFFDPSLYFIFILIALLGDLIRVYEKELRTTHFKYIVLSFIMSLFLFQLRPFIVDFLEKYHLSYPEYLINDTKSLNTILFSLCLFIIILKINIPKKLTMPILFIAASTFEVYLIHDNPLIRSILWNDVFKNNQFYWSNYFPIIVILQPLLVFIICIFIAKLRISLFKPLKINKFFS